MSEANNSQNRLAACDMGMKENEAMTQKLIWLDLQPIKYIQFLILTKSSIKLTGSKSYTKI